MGGPTRPTDDVAETMSKRQQLAIELSRMGFGRAAAGLAMQHGGTLEECLEWLSKQADGEPARIEPGKAGICNAHRVGVQQTGKGSSGRAASASPRRRATPEGNLSEQLLLLGFDENHTGLASKRCLTMEAAME